MGEGDDRGWDGWMASLTQGTWVWASSRKWWKTGKPGVLQSMGSQRVRHDWVTEHTDRASSSSAAKNIINLISVLTIWGCPCGVGRGYLLWPVCSLGKTLLPLPCFILYSKVKLSCYSRYLLTSYFCVPVPYEEKDIFFGVSSRRSCSSSYKFNFSFFGISGWGVDLDYCDFEWFALEIKSRSFCHFWDCTQVLHFGLFGWLWGLLHFF